MFFNYDTFVFVDSEIKDKTVYLRYRLEGSNETPISFEEALTFPSELVVTDINSGAVKIAIGGLHIVGGVSYFKTCCPKDIRFENTSITLEDAEFWSEVYTHGLGEFFFRNGIKNPQPIKFPSEATSINKVSVESNLKNNPLVLIGGGKDSVVSCEVLKQAGIKSTLFSLGKHYWSEDAARIVGERYLVVERQLSPELFRLNAEGALNGHVPISAYIAFVSQLVAILGGYDVVIASNERSANFGNLLENDLEVNHQWSKSAQFESMFQDWSSRHFENGPEYFSLLRPLSELRVTKAFTSHKQYLEHFTSCNKNFSIQNTSSVKRWCGECPKCVFVFIMMLPWLNDSKMQQVFGSNFLNNPNTYNILEELLGLRGHKPFECVGTPEEVSSALWLCHSQRHYFGSLEFAQFCENYFKDKEGMDSVVEQILKPSKEHFIPSFWEEKLYAYLRDH